MGITQRSSVIRPRSAMVTRTPVIPLAWRSYETVPIAALSTRLLYTGFLKVALANPDLRLFSAEETPELSAEQKERMVIIFSMLVSLFERAYLLLYEDDMSRKQLRRWRSWEDYMREWCRRADFRTSLPVLLQGEDPDFVSYIQALVASEVAGNGA